MRQLEFNDLSWCLRRMPTKILEMMKKYGPNIVVAGGFVRSTIANETINDIDLFCPTKELAKQYADELGDGKSYETDNAYTIRTRRYCAQFIHRWTYPNPEELLKSFDFTVACGAFWYDGVAWQSLTADAFYADLAAKRLVYLSPQRNEDAGGSLLRVLKFYQRGYRIPLDSLGAVIARLLMGVDDERLAESRLSGLGEEKAYAKIITGLLREVDPLLDPTHAAHLPSTQEDENVIKETN